ncbi:MAG TPA: hypothetical protein V6D13_17835 [Halomicronema sp.]
MGEQLIQTPPVKKLRDQMRWHKLSLAVYREIAAHLRQVEGVETGLLPVPAGEPFECDQSQVGGLWVEYPPTIAANERHLMEQILAYYNNRYGSFERLGV